MAKPSGPDLDAFLAARGTRSKAGFMGVMDKIDPHDKELVIEKYVEGVQAPILREWISNRYPEIAFTHTNFDKWLHTHWPRRSGVAKQGA